MEIEGGPDSGTARDHLADLNDAMRASAVAGANFDPWWAYPIIAFAGPAIIFYVTSRDTVAGEGLGDFFQVGWVVLAAIALIGAIAGIAVSFRSSRVRPKSPARGGQTTKWAFLSSLSVTLPIIMGGNYADTWTGGRPVSVILLSAVFYVWLAIVPAYFYRRHAATLAQVRAI